MCSSIRSGGGGGGGEVRPAAATTATCARAKPAGFAKASHDALQAQTAERLAGQGPEHAPLRDARDLRPVTSRPTAGGGAGAMGRGRAMRQARDCGYAGAYGR